MQKSILDGCQLIKSVSSVLVRVLAAVSEDPTSVALLDLGVLLDGSSLRIDFHVGHGNNIIDILST